MSDGDATRGAEVTRPAPRPPAVPLIFSAVLLVWLLAFLAFTVQPGYRGGSFVAVVLAGTALALAIVLVSEAIDRRHGGRAGAGDARVSPSEALLPTEAPLKAARVARAFWFSLLLIGLVVVCGVYLGTPLTLYWICRRHCRSGAGFAAVFSVVVGTALPYVFALIVSIELWTGVVPELVPGWLGGGLLPPV